MLTITKLRQLFYAVSKGKNRISTFLHTKINVAFGRIFITISDNVSKYVCLCDYVY